MTTFKLICLSLLVGLATTGCKSGNPALHNDIQAAMQTTKPNLDACYQLALARNRHTAGGFFTIEFLVDGASGQFKNVIVRRDEVADPAVRMCVIREVSKLQVKPSGQSNTEVSYAFKFVPTN